MNLIDFADLLGDVPQAHAAQPVRDVTSDSRTVEQGDVFVALTGTKTDGAKYIADAVAYGASAVVVGRDVVVSSAMQVPVFHVDDPRLTLALLAAKMHNQQPETIVAVTGTAGKTSVAAFARQIFNFCKKPAASIGTTGVEAPGLTIAGSLTTPDPINLHKMLQKLSLGGVGYVAMEASSHGLDQRRLDGVKLAAGGFTNLGRDHMDYHPTVEEYLGAKMRLFDSLLAPGQPAVIFADDPFSDQVIEVATKRGLKVLTVGRKGDFIALKRVEHERHRQIAEIAHQGVTRRIELPLAGDFQISNALVAAGLALSVGLEADAVFAALEQLKGAPGRLELVGVTKDAAPIYVDYAHKPEALEQVLLAVRPFTTGKVHVVFGCGGDRDPGKRPIMGEIAGRLADVCYVTDDNPRSEDPATIRAAIMEAVPEAHNIGDRQAAIETAIKALQKGDTLVIAGKGHETGQTANGATRHFSDHEEARAVLQSLGGKSL